MYINFEGDLFKEYPRYRYTSVVIQECREASVRKPPLQLPVGERDNDYSLPASKIGYPHEMSSNVS